MSSTDVAAKVYFPGDVHHDEADNAWMFVGSREYLDCEWRPALRITDVEHELFSNFVWNRVQEGRRSGRSEGKSGRRTFDERLRDEYIGVVSEHKAAQYLDVFCGFHHDPGNVHADLSADIQIRGVGEPWRGLIIRPHETHRTDRHVLVVVHQDYAAVVGFMYGHEVVDGGRTSRWWVSAGENGYWLVPGLQTRPMTEFSLPARTSVRWS